jgi:cytochrome c-type biogenesis protein
LATIALATLAGLLTILSPCVLPLIPIVLGAALAQHRFGPLTLAAGLTLSFTLLGLFVATLGFALDLDQEIFRIAAAIVMMLIGLVLLIPAAQERLAIAAGPLADWTEHRLGGLSPSGLSGQFGVGLLLGAVWTPCVGPTLGAASLLAARGENLGGVALTMLAFGLGAGLPLALMGFLSRRTWLAWRGRLAGGGNLLKIAFGLLLVLAGLAVVSGRDKQLETWLVQASPQGLTDLTTRF